MLEVWHIWVIAGLVLWIIEIFTSGFIIGVFGTACLIVAPFAGVGVKFNMQLLLFGIATAIISLGIRPIILRHFYSRESKISTNVHALIGKAALVTEAIDHDAGTGGVKIGGDFWRAVTSDYSKIEVGQKTVVRDIEGNKLVVESINKQGGVFS